MLGFPVFPYPLSLLKPMSTELKMPSYHPRDVFPGEGSGKLYCYGLGEQVGWENVWDQCFGILILKTIEINMFSILKAIRR